MTQLMMDENGLTNASFAGRGGPTARLCFSERVPHRENDGWEIARDEFVSYGNDAAGHQHDSSLFASRLR